MNKKPPEITFKKKDKGGINFTSTVAEPKVDLESVRAVLSEYKIHNADVHLRGDYDIDDLVDVIEGSRVYMPCIYVINKIDQITLEELNVLDRLPHYCPVCAYHEWNLDGLVEMIWEYLHLLRLYTKPKVRGRDWSCWWCGWQGGEVNGREACRSGVLPCDAAPDVAWPHARLCVLRSPWQGKIPDYNDPVILPAEHCTVEDFCNRLHKGIIKQFKYALVWGSSVKHRPQKVGRDHVLQDEDIIQIVKRV